MSDHAEPSTMITSNMTSSLKNKVLCQVLGALSMTAFSSVSFAASPVEYTNKDWQVVCDNTRTCRIAGYQADISSDFAASILLTRQAGANAEVTGEIKLGGDNKGSNKALLELGNRHRVALFINGKDLGETTPSSLGAGYAKLSNTQVNALLASLTKSSKIELVVRNSRWQVSDKGATAVLLKADIAQGRVGTASALVDPNPSKPNNSVFAIKEAPQLRLIAPDQIANTNSNKGFSLKASQLQTMMQETITESTSDCPKLTNKTPWRINRLNSTQLLAQHSCWSGVYNTGDGMWVINDTPPYNPKLITTSATNYDNKGVISSVQKGRGIGDCLAITEWIWTGKSFAKSYEGTTGLCRLVADGGAWKLPTYVTDIKR